MFRRRVVWLMVAGALIRLALALPLGLGVDESYAVASARQLHLSYFDHPPLSFWLTHLAATALGSESHAVVRLPFILLFAGSTWLMYLLTERPFGERAGWLAALALNLSAVFSVSTGSWVLPDGPLMCALLAAACCLARVLLDPPTDSPAWGWWIGGGIATGLGLLSKYQAVLFVAGVLLYMAARPAGRRWLRRPQPYVAGTVALALFAPVVIWNAHHGWASFVFQGSRGGPPPHLTAARSLGAVGQNLAGQIAWVLPWIWVPLVVALGRALRRPADDRALFFACLAVVPLALFLVVSLGGRPGQPHWPASGYLFLFPLLGARFAAVSVSPRGERRVRTWMRASAAALALLLMAGAVVAIGGIPFAHGGGAAGRPPADPTLEAVDWRDLRAGLDSLGVLGRPGTFVAAPSWVQAGKVAYALGPGVPVLCLSVDPREFAFLEDDRAFVGQDAIIVVRLPASQDPVARYAPSFAAVIPLGRVTIHRRRTPVFDVGVYRGHEFRSPPSPAVESRAARGRAIPGDVATGYLPRHPAPPFRPESAP